MKWRLPIGIECAVVMAVDVMTAPLREEQPAMNILPDYTKLVLNSNGQPRDSFSLVVQAAARLLGEVLDYETFYALSTNAFAPGMVLSEGECRGGRWLARGREYGLDILAGRLGLTISSLQLPPFSGSIQSDTDLDHYMAVIAPLLREHMDEGKLVVTTGGFTGNGHDYTWWVIITEVRDDGMILAGGINGRRDNHMAWPERFWTVTSDENTLSPEEADRMMLMRAVARIRADQPPFSDARWSTDLQPDQAQPVYFGLRAIDQWVEAMCRVPYCQDCGMTPPATMAGDLAEAASLVSHGAAVTASYLRGRLPSFPDAARPHITATAKCYDRIVEHFSLYTDCEYGATIMGDVVKQQTYAQAVLIPVKTELVAAADEMEKALAIRDTEKGSRVYK